MNNWSRPADIRARLLRRWEKGHFFQNESAFPLRVPLKSPASREMINHFPAVQKWVKELRAAEQAGKILLEWKAVNHQQLGRNEIPAALIFHTCDDLARFLGKKGELRDYRAAREALSREVPELADWAAAHPFALLEHAPVLEKLISAACWLRENPRPGIYLRQLSLPGIDTKFLENHKGILARWLDILLPPDAVDLNHTPGRGFARRYGFKSAPELIRFRILDPELQPATGGWSDLSVPAEEFCRWLSRWNKESPPFRRIFITENDINGLAFPAMGKSLVIFGRGYHFQGLADAEALQESELWYWGDIDTHGFAILSEFRSHFPRTQSLLMDRETLLAHREHWGTEPSPVGTLPAPLSEEEAALFQEIRTGALGEDLRLEQEFIRYDWVRARLASLPGPD